MKLLIAGDTHRNLTHLRYLLAEAERHDVGRIIQVGDFGFLFGDDATPEVEGLLADANVDLWWLDGNHEDFDLLGELYGACPNDKEPTQLSPHVTYLPRGYRFDIDGCRFMAFGGAVSIDKDWRIPHASWWPDETIKDSQVVGADGPSVDVLLSHDAPECPSALAAFLATAHGGIGYKPDAESRANRERLRLVYDAVRPALVVHGHYHHFYVDEMDHGRVVGLSRDTKGRESYLILDTDQVCSERVAVAS